MQVQDLHSCAFKEVLHLGLRALCLFIQGSYALPNTRSGRLQGDARDVV